MKAEKKGAADPPGHQLGVLAAWQTELEGVSEGFLLHGLERARERTLQAFEGVRAGLREGMTENDCRLLALEVCSGLGATRHWHRPYVRFGEGTLLTFNDLLRPEDFRLCAGDPVYVDLGPVWPALALGLEGSAGPGSSGLEYEGDYGDSFALGGHSGEAESLAQLARELFASARQAWHEEGLSGEALYRFLDQEAARAGHTRVGLVNGHRLSEFPHHRHTKAPLARMPFVPAGSRWVLEVMIHHGKLPIGAFFEDLLG